MTHPEIKVSWVSLVFKSKWDADYSENADFFISFPRKSALVRVPE